MSIRHTKRNRSYDGGCRRSFSEWMDSVLSSGIGRQLLVYLGTIIIVYAFFVLLSFSLNGFELTKDNSSETGSRLLGVLYYFLDPGNLYVEQNSSARFLTPVISLLGMFLLGGLLITTLSNGVEQRISNIKNGLVHYRNIHGHYVVIGFGEISLSLLRDIFEKNGYVPGQKTGGLPKIVILTSQNVEQVRAIIEAGLPDGMSRKVIIYAGNIESREHLEKLNISRAREVFILGEQDEYGRDTKNLEAIRTIHELCADRDRTLKVNVQFDRPSSYSIIKKIELEPSKFLKNRDGKTVIYFRPFNFFENWARLLWGINKKSTYEDLDFKPLDKPGRHVHLIICGFGCMGKALLLEALRICHYPNFNGDTGSDRTEITVIDPEIDRLKTVFLAQYPYLSQIKDININFISGSTEDENIRRMISSCASEPSELTTIAICISDPDTSLATGLSLPDEVYCQEDSDDPDVQVLIRQEIMNSTGFAAILDNEGTRYRNVRSFGMLSEGISHRLLDDTMAMLANATYAIPGFFGGLTDSGKRDGLLAMAADFWYQNSEDLRFSNRYQTEMYGIYARYEHCGTKALSRMEHLRWIAERSVIGYRYAEKKSRVYKTHNLLIPFNRLPEKEMIKDTLVIDMRIKILDLCKKINLTDLM